MPNPIARRTDPETSHLAAAEITGTGKRNKQALQVLELVRKNPGCTSLELASARVQVDSKTGPYVDRYQIARRMADLVAQGKVAKGPTRRCKLGNRPAPTWWEVQ